MSRAYAGLYTEVFLQPETGDPLPNTAITVYVRDSLTELADLYVDAQKTESADNPFTTDDLGNGTFLAEPGHYDLEYEGRRFPITVDPDPDESEDAWLSLPASIISDSGSENVSRIQAAVDAAFAAGKLYVRLPPGNIPVTYVEHPNWNVYACAIRVPSGMHLTASLGGTNLVLDADQTVGDLAGSVIMNENPLTGDERITVSNLCINGNGDNQTLAQIGILLINVAHPRIEKVVVKNCRGTGFEGPPDETSLVVLQWCSDARVVDSEAYCDDGPTSVGFGDQTSVGSRYINCSVHGMTVSHGFGMNGSRNVIYQGCWSYQNALQGFNFETGENVVCNGCVAGGRGPAQDAFPHEADESLGNGGSGFAANDVQAVQLSACIADRNALAGAVFTLGATARITGGSYTNNDLGVNMQGTVDPGDVIISPETLISDNDSFDVVHNSPGPGTLTTAGFQLLDLPAASPAGVITVTNPYPWDVTLFEYPGGGPVDYVEFSGAGGNIGVPSCIPYPAGATIIIHFSGADPTYLATW